MTCVLPLLIQVSLSNCILDHCIAVYVGVDNLYPIWPCVVTHRSGIDRQGLTVFCDTSLMSENMAKTLAMMAHLPQSRDELVCIAILADTAGSNVSGISS